MEVGRSRTAENGASSCPAPALVRAALRRMVASRDLHLSDRNKQFLDYVVEETLCGRGGRIKAYVIGVDVFGRSDDFNPNLDPIVRIEATRLRSALSAYYAVTPREAIRIVMKPGSYVPSFEWGEDAVINEPALCSADGRHATRTIAIVRREVSSRGDDPCEAMLIQAVASLLAAEGFRMFLTDAHHVPASKPAADLSLDIAVWPLTIGRRYALTLTDADTAEFLWSIAIDRSDGGPPHAEDVDGVALQAARSLLSAVRA